MKKTVFLLSLLILASQTVRADWQSDLDKGKKIYDTVTDTMGLVTYTCSVEAFTHGVFVGTGNTLGQAKHMALLSCQAATNNSIFCSERNATCSRNNYRPSLPVQQESTGSYEQQSEVRQEQRPVLRRDERRCDYPVSREIFKNNTYFYNTCDTDLNVIGATSHYSEINALKTTEYCVSGVIAKLHKNFKDSFSRWPTMPDLEIQEQFNDNIKNFAERLRIPPGITQSIYESNNLGLTDSGAFTAICRGQVNLRFLGQDDISNDGIVKPLSIHIEILGKTPELAAQKCAGIFKKLQSFNKRVEGSRFYKLQIEIEQTDTEIAGQVQRVPMCVNR